MSCFKEVIKTMKHFTALFCIILIIITANISYASASCEFIKENDRKNFCRAVSKKMPTWCEFIKDNTLKIECRILSKKK
jgi:hypothetical protein